MPRLTANGALLRVNYQIDGNDNTEKDRAGLRQMPMSEVMIREVKVVTTGYAPEFGQTMGLVYNAITPSGTNSSAGRPAIASSGSRWWRCRSSRPRHDRQAADRGEHLHRRHTAVRSSRDRTHSTSAASRTRSATSRAARVVTITPANAARLGLDEPAYIPAAGEYEVRHRQDRSRARSTRTGSACATSSSTTSSAITSAATASGVPNSVQQGTDFSRPAALHGRAAGLDVRQRRLLNELRVQYATRTPVARPRARRRAPGRASASPAWPISAARLPATPMPASGSPRGSSRCSTT